MTLTDEAVIPESDHGSPNCQLPTDNGLDKTYEIMAANGQIRPFDREIETKAIDSDKKRTSEMTCFMDELCLNSPKVRPSRSRSKTHSSKRKSSGSSRSGSSRSGSSRSGSSRSGSSRSGSSRSSSSRSSSSRSSSSRSSSSCSSSRSRSRSHSRERRYSKRYRRRSRSYSRSRSRSYSPCEKRHYYRRRYRSPPRYRSRSRSYSRYASYHRSRYSRSRSRSRGRRYYGFIRRHYSPTFRSYGSRSRSRSCSRTSLRLSEKEKLELLEIAKVNAAKVFGKEIELPESLIKDLKKEHSRKTEDSTSRSTKTIQRGPPGSTDSEKDKNTRNTIKEHAEVAHKSPYMLWRPVTMDSKSFSNSLSPKSSHTSRLR